MPGGKQIGYGEIGDIAETVGETAVERTRRRLAEFNGMVARARETTAQREARITATTIPIINEAKEIQGERKLPTGE